MNELNPELATDPGRRRLLTGLAIGGTAIVGGVVGAGTAEAMSDGPTRDQLAFDVACRIDTWREASVNIDDDDKEPDELRAPFLVEGVVYPAGTIPEGDGFVVTNDGSIGRWFCRGWLIINANRPQPHMTTDHQYYFGAVDPTEMWPADTLLSTGLEGNNAERWTSTRAITGGTGAYLGATGAITQSQIGRNTTVIDDLAGPNFQFTADMVLPA